MGHGKPEPDKVGELREATRLANEALKDLRIERKAFQELVDSIRPETRKMVEEKITQELDDLTVQMKAGVDSAVEKVFKRFEKLENLILGGYSESRPALEVVAEAFVQKKAERDANRNPPRSL